MVVISLDMIFSSLPNSIGVFWEGLGGPSSVTFDLLIRLGKSTFTIRLIEMYLTFWRGEAFLVPHIWQLELLNIDFKKFLLLFFLYWRSAWTGNLLTLKFSDCEVLQYGKISTDPILLCFSSDRFRSQEEA